MRDAFEERQAIHRCPLRPPGSPPCADWEQNLSLGGNVPQLKVWNGAYCWCPKEGERDVGPRNVPEFHTHVPTTQRIWEQEGYWIRVATKPPKYNPPMHINAETILEPGATGSSPAAMTNPSELAILKSRAFQERLQRIPPLWLPPLTTGVSAQETLEIAISPYSTGTSTTPMMGASAQINLETTPSSNLTRGLAPRSVGPPAPITEHKAPKVPIPRLKGSSDANRGLDLDKIERE